MKKWKRLIVRLLFCVVCVSTIQVYAENMQSEAEKTYEQKPAIVDSENWRKEKAKELDLENWIDEEGYLVERFYENKSDKELEDMGVHGLVRSVLPEELDAYVFRLNAGMAIYTVTRYQKIQEGYDITGIFEVDGNLAFCIQHSVSTPAAGSPTSAPIQTSNDDLRKALYYGYNGPASAGYSYVQTAMAASQANGVYAGNTGNRVMAEIAGKPSPPSDFKVWVVQTNWGGTQDLAFYTLEKKGTAYVEKKSGNTQFTDGNTCYSRQGAVYGLYTNAACTVKAATLTTGADGRSNTVELTPGTYYAKEITAPKGYSLSTEVKPIVVQADQLTGFSMADVPQAAPISVILQKADAETLKNIPQGSGTLADAQFAVKYYKGEYGEGVDPADLKKTPDRQWVFRTNEKGEAHFSEDNKVSGHGLWKNSSGKPILPLGTITVQEVKAPEGYHLNSEIFVRKITGGGTGQEVHTYKQIKVPDNVLKIDLLKRQEGTEIPIPKAEFEHIKPDKTTERVKTDSEGALSFRGLQRGTHQIKEISVMDGYELNGNIIEFIVAEDNTIIFSSKMDESKGKITLEVTENGNIEAVVEDLPAPFSVVVHKVNENGKTLEGAEFTLYEDSKCTKKVMKGRTGAEGILKLDGMKVKAMYYLKETKAPPGYRIPVDLFGNSIVYKIQAESTPVKDEFTVFVNEKSDGMVVVKGTKAEREAHITIENKTGFQLPDTGSRWMLPMLFFGGGLCVWSVLFYKRKLTKTRRKNMRKRIEKVFGIVVLLVMMAVTVNPQTAEARETVTTERGIADFRLGNASITIRGNQGQSLNGKVFQVYKLFHAENALGMESINYTVNEPFRNSLQSVVGKRLAKNPAAVTEYEMIDYIQTLNTDLTEGANTTKKEEGRYSEYRYFIEELRDEIVKEKVLGDVVRIESTKSNNSVVIEGLQYGYYIIDEVTSVDGSHSAASLCIVNTVNPDAAVHVKADYPSVIKKIQEDDNQDTIGNNGWNDMADFEIGQTVPYKYESNIPNMNGYDRYYYAWHDMMDEALTFQEDSVKIVIQGTLNGSSKKYELKSNEFQVLTDKKNAGKFKVEVQDIKAIVDREFNRQNSLGENQYGQHVLLTYQAVLNDKAASDTGRPGFENDVRLEFSNDPDSDNGGSTGFTPWDTVVCFTYKINGLKVNNHNQNLKEAKFRLYSDEACKKEVYVKKADDHYIVLNKDSAGTGVPADAVCMVSGTDGAFKIYGLDSGVYYLKEIKAPAGYRPLDAPIVIQIKAAFTDDRNNYMKGDGATDKTLRSLTATAHVQQFLEGTLRDEDMDLAANLTEGSVNLTVINTVGKKLPITGSSGMFVLIGGGLVLMMYSFVKGRRKNE